MQNIIETEAWGGQDNFSGVKALNGNSLTDFKSRILYAVFLYFTFWGHCFNFISFYFIYFILVNVLWKDIKV